jgi:phenylpyruvate tautomerase PptA (4-oxalocrotonate tautomerase family)
MTPTLRYKENIAVIILNVKQADFLQIDIPGHQLSEQQKTILAKGTN